MIPAFNRGEMVRLTRRVANTFAANPKSKIGELWKTRTGAVVWCNRNSVFVRWEGMTSGDQLPVAAIERIG
jgi:hypothetical protein